MANNFFKVNKGIGLVPQSSDPSPANNGDIYYNSTLNKFRKYENGAWSDLGSGSGNSGIITGDDSNFESSLGSWVTYADAAGTQPVDGTGGSPNITLTRITTSGDRLNGIASAQISKGGVNRQGEGISLDITVPNYIKGQPCKVQFSLNGSLDFGTAFDSADPSDVTVYLYDITNSKLIQPYPYTLFSNGIYEGMFQIPSNCANLRLILHITTTSAVGWTMVVDDFSITAALNETVKADSDPENFTPTFTSFGTVTVTGGKCWKEGSELCGFAYFTSGSPAAALATMTLPAGLVLNTNVLTRGNTTAASGHVVGYYTHNGNGNHGALVTATGTSTTLLYFASNTNLNSNLTPSNANNVIVGGNLAFVHYRVPILGWTSGQTTAASANLNAPVVFYGTQSSQAVTADVTNITFTSVKDTVSGWSTNIYTVKTPGDYEIRVAGTLNAAFRFNFYKNGTSHTPASTASTAGFFSSGSALFTDLIAGDTISVRSSVTGTCTVSNFSINKVEMSGRVYSTRVAYIKDIKAANSAGGTATSGSYQTRNLNTIEGDSSFVSLSSNQFTLQPGTYKITASAPASGASGTSVLNHKIKLRNITDSTDTIIGTSEYVNSPASTAHTTRSMITGTFSITTAKTFEIQHRVNSTRATDGFGFQANFGDSEVYTQVEIEKVL